MEETTPPPPAGRKKIRLTKTEAYALSLATPRRRGVTFVLIGGLLLSALGAGLWYFQDFWLPFWLPTEEAAAPASTPADSEPAPAATNKVQAQAPAPHASEPVGTALPGQPVFHEYLSAAIWDHLQFRQAVQLFNEALDTFRGCLRDHLALECLRRAEEGARQSTEVFESIRSEAPPAVPINDYVLRSRALLNEVRSRGHALAAPPPEPVLASAPAAKQEVDLDSMPPRTRPPAPPPRPGEAWQEPDYLAGAQLFNQALEQYKLFLADKSRTDLLKPIEDSAYQAAKKFESLLGLAPTNVPLSSHISQCYRLISDCRRQTLENKIRTTPEPRRSTTGPQPRPALPPYQPPPPAAPAAGTP